MKRRRLRRWSDWWITQVVGNREFQGSSTTAQGGDGDLLSISCSYEKIPDVAKDISSYITTLTTTYGFTVSTPFDVFCQLYSCAHAENKV